jgi:hypothetical protein
MWFTDSRDRMTASQRLRVERRMARDAAMGTITRHGTTRDEEGKPVANYTMENGGMKEAPGAGKIHLHFHGSTGDEFNEGPATPSVTSGREPAMPGGDLEERVESLEQAFVVLVGGGQPDDDNGDDPNQFTSDPTDGPDITSQIASQHVASTDVGGKVLYGPKGQPSGYQIETADDDPAEETTTSGWQQGASAMMSGAGAPMGAMDELPDIADINAKNRKFWAGSSSQSVTGMGDVPIGGQGTPGRTDNGIDVNRRLSTGTKRLDPGRTSNNSLKAFGTTSDANMRRILKIEDRAYANKVLMQSTNKRIAAQQRANEKLR